MVYRKKPVEIEAFCYDGDLRGSDGQYYVPDWAKKAFEDGVMYYDSPDCSTPPCELYIKTLEGIHHVSVGDYIIQGIEGELYPCKPDIFKKTYEAVMIENEESFGGKLLTGWIPCDERVPEKDIDVLVDLGDESPVIARRSERDGDKWINSSTGNIIYFNVIAWMPLPEPYREES